jgi:hypothetical protein
MAEALLKLFFVAFRQVAEKFKAIHQPRKNRPQAINQRNDNHTCKKHPSC